MAKEVKIGVAEERLSDPKDPLIGKCFIVRDKDGRRDWDHQGVVTGKIADGVYLVRLFDSFPFGTDPNTLFCVSLSTMVTSDFTSGFEFFEDEEHLRNWCAELQWVPPDDGGE